MLIYRSVPAPLTFHQSFILCPTSYFEKGIPYWSLIKSWCEQNSNKRHLGDSSGNFSMNCMVDDIWELLSMLLRVIMVMSHVGECPFWGCHAEVFRAKGLCWL